MSEINIANVSVKKSDTSYDLLTLHQFLRKPLSERHDLIKGQKIEFIDADGERIKTIDGLKAITELIKKLREDGNLVEWMTKKT